MWGSETYHSRLRSVLRERAVGFVVDLRGDLVPQERVGGVVYSAVPGECMRSAALAVSGACVSPEGGWWSREADLIFLLFISTHLASTRPAPICRSKT